MGQAERLATGSRPHDLSIVLMDDRAIAEVNRALLNHAGATDVITIRYGPMPGEAAGGVAEVYVNVERAARMARPGWPAGRELALYIAHGCDHLAGEDDATPSEYRRMRRRELRWLREAERDGVDLNLVKETS